MLQTNNCDGTKIQKKVDEDKISELSDDLLIKILDLVPVRDAVSTMVLSKRWFPLWTYKRHLEYKDNSEDDYDDSDTDDIYYSDSDDDNVDESKKSIWWFLDKSLQFHKAPVIHSLIIKLGGKCPIDADVEKWVSNAVDRCIVHMELKLLWSGYPTSLPNSFYSCKSLKTLTLSYKIILEVPFSASLPSLKDLELLYVMYENNDSVVRFLSSCPNLERLSVMRNTKDDHVTKFLVKVPKLLYLKYKSTKSLQMDNDVGDTGMSLVIDTPKLKEFEIISGDSCSFKMSCLDVAYIDLWYCPDEKSSRSLSSVSYLTLVLTNEMVWFSSIKFINLVDCKIYVAELGWIEPTILLLQNSPKLKLLMVDSEYTPEKDDDSFSWNKPSVVPECLSSKLESFEWKGFGGKKEEDEFVIYVLKNSSCLKMATISLKFSSNLDEQRKMVKELENIPRASTECNLVFKYLNEVCTE